MQAGQVMTRGANPNQWAGGSTNVKSHGTWQCCDVWDAASRTYIRKCPCKSVNADGTRATPPPNCMKAQWNNADGWALENNPTNPDATPAAFDSILDTFKTIWSADDWMTWFTALGNKYGHDKAVSMWQKAWDAQSFWSSNMSWAKYNSKFNQFLKDNGISGESNAIANTTVGAEKAIGNATGAIDFATKIIPIIIIAAIVIGGIVLLSYRKTASA